MKRANDPKDLARAYDKALTAHRTSRYAEAERLYRGILASDPQHGDSLQMLGVLLHQQKKSAEGLAFLRQAVARGPASAGLYNNFGAVLRAAGHPEEAFDAYEVAVGLLPDYVEAWTNRGNVLRDLGRPFEAIASYERTLALRPDDFAATYGLACAAHESGDFDRAEAMQRRSLALRPGDPAVTKDLAMALLMKGDYLNGAASFEARFAAEPETVGGVKVDLPKWTGQPLAGKTLLLNPEQGLGDSLQFIRWAPLLQAQGARVLFACPHALRRLIARTPGIDDLLDPDQPMPPADYQVSLMTLMPVTGMTIDTIPANTPYLFADPQRAAAWRARFAADGPGLKVGLVWAGNPAFRSDIHRSPGLRRFLPLFQVPGVRFYGLQMGPGRKDIGAVPGMEITDLGGEIKDFADTADILGGLDLLISSCTSPVHLAGGMNMPTWVALRRVPDWRWHAERADSPWYPSVRLYRQPVNGDWPTVMGHMARDLAQLVAGRRGPLWPIAAE